MIVRETPTSFFYLNQHDHAQISGELARHWRQEYFIGQDKREEVELAIYQHDRGWINLDAAPFWNDKTAHPYTFQDFPAPPKVVHYHYGLNEVEQLNAYAGLLCSLHYTSLTSSLHNEYGQHFLAIEEKRQQRIREQLQLNTPEKEEQVKFHVQLLKFCDDLSLYLCLNEPGVFKENEHPWYKAGMPHSNNFAFTPNQLIQAKWVTPHEVKVCPFPFEKDFTITIQYKELKKEEIRQNGLADCFHRTEEAEFNVLIRE